MTKSQWCAATSASMMMIKTTPCATSASMMTMKTTPCATKTVGTGRRRRRGGGGVGVKRGRCLRVRASGGRFPPEGERDPRLISRREKAQNRQNAKTWVVVGGLALAMTTVVALVYDTASDGFLYGVDSIESYASYGGASFDFDAAAVADGGRLGAAALAGAVIWAVGLYYASPISIVMLFLGRTDSERPSDWVLRLATGTKKMEDASIGAKLAVAAWFAIAGAAVSTVGTDFLDSTWGISTGVGFLTIAGVSELGRPKRIDEATLEKLEAQYADFCEFASKRLSRSGRVHQTEISRAFRNAYPQYASEDVLEERDLRSLIANFAPAAERSPRGYYKNLSLVNRDGVPVSQRPSVQDLGL
jgi:hypothetical protein